MTSMLHYLATHNHINSIYPIALNHLYPVTINEVNDKIRDVQKLINSFEKTSVFKPPTLYAEMDQTLD